jgi:hypothetical protein
MSFHRVVGALALAAFVLAGCQKTADKGKTEDQLVSAGFTKDQAKCITDDIWDKIPKSERDKLTDNGKELTEDQKTVFYTAMVTCAHDKVVEEITSGVGTTLTPDQLTCLSGKLTNELLVNVMKGQTDELTTVMTSCVTS